MTQTPTTETETVSNSTQPAGRTRKVEISPTRVRRDGKFFRLAADKFHVKGVTYGPFAPNAAGEPLPEIDRVRQDMQLVKAMHGNCLRLYHTPPQWMCDLAVEMGVKLFVDIAWPKNLLFADHDDVVAQAKEAVRKAAKACGNHAAVFALSVVNEMPPDLVRYAGKNATEDLIDDLVDIVKEEAPDCLVTFANFPTTEYLSPRKVDFHCFNVYLHDPQTLRNYLARLQSLSGDKPLILGEYGIDTLRERTPEQQADVLSQHVKAVFDEGLCGTFIFSFTDDWHTHGYQITDWAFGLTQTDRTPKPAYYAVSDLFRRAPQLTDLKLPKASVVICSYNGASTVETCLRSMQRINYPDYEVVFVDDGSTDHTQDIVQRFPTVVNVRQKNMGLSYARNVGANAATGEVIIYTDSDCEADEDWLYYLCLALVRGNFGGVGGPNLIPDEGSWVADCVGLSPGGPTHVMIDDRTADHVPGCNMAFWKKVLEQVNGFDSQFRKAGDDVDVIWRIQNLGYAIGFSPAAQVWHYRRNTVKAYLKQQRGYGEAEAMLRYKHPDHFNLLGASHWRGRIYGGEDVGIRVGRDVIYHGVFGSGLFQTLYRRQSSMLAAMLMSIEWHLLSGFVLLLGLVFPPLLWPAGLMILTPLVLACVAAAQAPRPKHPHPFSRLLIAYLNYRQPISRGWERYAVRLKAKGFRAEAEGYARNQDLPMSANERRTLLYWHHEHERMTLLKHILDEVKQAGWRHRADSGWGRWDMEIYGSRYVKARITTATEIHHGSGLLTRVRVQILMSTFCKVLMVGILLLSAVLLMHLWPYSRPAVLLPLAAGAMYLYNKSRVSAPVLGLIDEAAEKAGMYPVRK